MTVNKYTDDNPNPRYQEMDYQILYAIQDVSKILKEISQKLDRIEHTARDMNPKRYPLG